MFNLFQAGFDANWEVDVFGGNRRSVEAADASVEAAEDDRNAVLVSLMGEVGLEYVTYRSLQQRIALANQNLAAQQGTLDLTRRLFNAGLAPELDVQRAAAQVATTASTIPLLEQQAAQAMHALSVLIGEPPMTLQQELAAVGPIPKPPAQVAVGLPSELLLRRPDVARSERQLAAQTAEIGVATRDLFPRFFITGAASLQSVRASDFFDWESRALSIGPSVSWPIFSGGRIRANIALQTAAQQELLAAYQAAVLQAFQDVEDALVAFSHEQATRAQLEDAVRANRARRRPGPAGLRPGAHRLPHRARGGAIGLHLAGHARADRARRRAPAGRALQGGRWRMGRRRNGSGNCGQRKEDGKGMTAGADSTGHLSPERFQALLAVAESITSCRDPEELFGRLARQLQRVVRFDCLGLVLVQPERGVTTVRILETTGTGFTTLPEYPVDGSPSGWVIETQQPLIVSNTAAETRWPRAMAELRDRGIVSFCSLPLTTAAPADRRLGLREPQAGRRTRLTTSTSWREVAKLVAVAIDNALNFDAGAGDAAAALDRARSSPAAARRHQRHGLQPRSARPRGRDLLVCWSERFHTSSSPCRSTRRTAASLWCRRLPPSRATGASMSASASRARPPASRSPRDRPWSSAKTT